MKVLFINNDGGGFADHIEVAEGTTVRQLFQQQNNLPAAEQEFRRALAVNPQNEQAVIALQQVQAHLRMRQ